MDSLECKQCGSAMSKTKKVDRSLGLQLVGVFLFLFGFVLLFLFPVGTLVGIITMIVACRLGYKQTKVWKCDNCGYFFERG